MAAPPGGIRRPSARSIFRACGAADEAFVAHKLGALNADLAALASFFDEIWLSPAKDLRETSKARVLGYAAFALRALGRLREAVEPFEAGLNVVIAAARLGKCSPCRRQCLRTAPHPRRHRGRRSPLREPASRTQMPVATPSGGQAHRATLADALHHGGQAREAQVLFEEAEAIQAQMAARLPKLYSVQGYRYCDFLLARGQAQTVVARMHQIQEVWARQPGWQPFPLDDALYNLSSWARSRCAGFRDTDTW